MALGQYLSHGPVEAWAVVCPVLKGLGVAMVITSLLIPIYYNVVISWSIYYLYNSFAPDVPWKSCENEWNTATCSEAWGNFTSNCTTSIDQPLNCRSTVKLTSPSEEFWERYILAMSNGIDEPGQIRWPLAICLLFAWTAVFLCLYKGIKSSGKRQQNTALTAVFCCLYKGIKSSGKINACATDLLPFCFLAFLSGHIWLDRDAVVVGTINCLTSFFGGFVIFSVIGFMAHSLNKEVSEVVSSGPGLGFVAYPEGIAQMPAASVWAVVFFFMLFTIGMGSQGGIYVLSIFDSQSGGFCLMSVVIFEAVAVSWGYGVDKFCENIKSMIGKKPNMYFIICWKYITPIVGMFIFFGSLSQWEKISFDGNVYPDWAQAVAWLLALLSFLAIPIGAIFAIFHPKGSFRERQPIAAVNIAGSEIKTSVNARDLEVTLDQCLTMSTHVSNLCKSASFALKRIGNIRQYLDQPSTEKLVHAFVSSKLDYCNSLLYGLPDKEISKIQRVQNSAARLITRTRRADRITPILRELHWLPVRKRIIFKILLLTFKVLNDLAPSYLAELINIHRPIRSLRSNNDHLRLQRPVFEGLFIWRRVVPG
ncbi:hypothetical protein ACROYT_G043774 [Oculina patagonica]